jgi:recombination protein RecR
MNPLNKLTELFGEFPGIGPRQAKRFAYFLAMKNPQYSKELAATIQQLQGSIMTCSMCYRLFTKNENGTTTLCSICSNSNRDSSLLAVVSRDSDLESLEKSGSYSGLYFVLGGVVPILDSEPDKKIRSRELVAEVEKRVSHGLKEIILALSANADSENTAQYVGHLLTPFKEKGLIITLLGRGLSTGTELEYSDADTLRNALDNRK